MVNCTLEYGDLVVYKIRELSAYTIFLFYNSFIFIIIDMCYTGGYKTKENFEYGWDCLFMVRSAFGPSRQK